MTRMLFRFFALSLVLGFAVGAPSCGGATADERAGGTDSNTHWLDMCTSDSDCGTLDCLCGVCTKRCADDDACATFDDSAVCADPGTCGVMERELACIVPCARAEDCPGSSFDCVAGQCVKRPDARSAQDGGGPSDSGTPPNCEGVTCTTDDCQEGFEEYIPPGACCKICRRTDCSAMDARNDGTLCAGGTGHTWNGSDCLPIACGCEGSECEKLYRTAADCRIDYADCLAADDPCRPMDAFSNGDDCGAIPGYAYDGRTCYAIDCGCTGSDCDRIAPTFGECAQARLGCESFVSTECDRHSDCAIVPAGCCGPCGLTSFDFIVALNASTATAHTQAVCRADEACPDCVTSHNPMIYAACDAGSCVAIDATPFADCTTDDDCVVRARECCECGADLTGLVSVSDPNGYAQRVCEGVQGCDLCLPTYPDGANPRCDNGRCILQ